MRFPTMSYVHPAKAQTSLHIRTVSSEPLLVAKILYKLLTEHNFEFLSLTEGCTGSSESTLDKIPHCWKSHVTAHLVSSYLIDALFELGSLHMIVWGRVLLFFLL